VLIEYGDRDAVTAGPSKEAFAALRRLGKIATLVGYPEEGHGVGKPENRLDFTNRVLDWFDHYLKPGELSSVAH
jgi:dipeptidyl aminopeptidase/acylaminoacyl peptidase